MKKNIHTIITILNINDKHEAKVIWIRNGNEQKEATFSSFNDTIEAVSCMKHILFMEDASSLVYDIVVDGDDVYYYNDYDPDELGELKADAIKGKYID